MQGATWRAHTSLRIRNHKARLPWQQRPPPPPARQEFGQDLTAEAAGAMATKWFRGSARPFACRATGGPGGAWQERGPDAGWSWSGRRELATRGGGRTFSPLRSCCRALLRVLLTPLCYLKPFQEKLYYVPGSVRPSDLCHNGSLSSKVMGRISAQVSFFTHTYDMSIHLYLCLVTYFVPGTVPASRIQ